MMDRTVETIVATSANFQDPEPTHPKATCDDTNTGQVPDNFIWIVPETIELRTEPNAIFQNPRAIVNLSFLQQQQDTKKSIYLGPVLSEFSTSMVKIIVNRWQDLMILL